MWQWVCAYLSMNVSSVWVCERAALQTFVVCAHIWKAFLWHDLNACHTRTEIHLRERQENDQTWDKHIPWNWQEGMTDREEHVSNMPSYASDTFEKLAVKGKPFMRVPFIQRKSVWPLKKSFPASVLYVLEFVMVYRFYVLFFWGYLFICFHFLSHL